MGSEGASVETVASPREVWAERSNGGSRKASRALVGFQNSAVGVDLRF
jgi:hypothetical protein